MPKSVTIEALAAWLREQDDVLLLGHVNPDGDAVGSTLAIWHALQALGKRAVVCLPGDAPVNYRDLAGFEAVLDTCEPLPFAPKAALSVDVSEIERLGEAGRALYEGCASRAMLDHHHTNRGFGELYYVDGQAAAAGEIVVDLIEALGVTMSREMAECLFVAISTDCGNFNFPNTRPQTLRAVAKCLEAGADIAALTRRLYRTRSLGQTKLLGLVLAGLEISGDGKIAWARLTEAMLAEAGARREDNVNIVNYLLEIDGVSVAILAEQRGEATKLSLRSNPPYSVVSHVALPLGGGGHDCAAGATLALPMEEALQRAIALAEKGLE